GGTDLHEAVEHRFDLAFRCVRPDRPGDHEVELAVEHAEVEVVVVCERRLRGLREARLEDVAQADRHSVLMRLDAEVVTGIDEVDERVGGGRGTASDVTDGRGWIEALMNQHFEMKATSTLVDAAPPAGKLSFARGRLGC